MVDLNKDHAGIQDRYTRALKGNVGAGPEGLLTAGATSAASLIALMKNSPGNLQNVASYVATSRNDKAAEAGNRPQLTPPGGQAGAMSDAMSYDDILASLEECISYSSAGENAAHLEKVIQTRRDRQAEIEQNWQTFQGDLANLAGVTSEAEKALTALTNLPSNPTQQEVEVVSGMVQAAYTQSTAAMTQLDESMGALLLSGSPDRFNKFDGVLSQLSLLDQVLRAINFHSKEKTSINLDNQTALFKTMQQVVQNRLMAAADEHRAAQAKAGLFGKVFQWVLAALTTALTLMTGGVAGVVMAAISAAITIADLASGGVISEKVLQPMMKPLMTGIEKIMTAINDAMVKAGCDGTASSIVAAIVTVIIVAVVACALGKLGGALANTNVGKAVIGGIGKHMITPIMGAINAGVEWLKQGVQKLAQVISGAVAEAGAKLATWKSVQLIAKGLNTIIDGFVRLFPMVKVMGDAMKAMLNSFVEGFKSGKLFMMNHIDKLQKVAFGAATSIEASLALVVADVEKQGQEAKAIITMTTTDHDNVAKQIKENTERWSQEFRDQDKFIEMLIGLIQSENDVLKNIGHRMAPAH